MGSVHGKEGESGLIKSADLSPIAETLFEDLDWIEQELAERSLWEFTRQMWKWIDPAPFRDSWHIGCIAEHLEAVNLGQIHRLIINIPPRHMKSIGVAVAWPVWTWIRRPETHLLGPSVQFLFASYAQALSIRDSVKCRRLIDSPKFQERWGDRFSLTTDQNTKGLFENDQKGRRLAASVDSHLTGEGGDIIVIDDAHNVRDKESEVKRMAALDWWDQSVSNRLNDSVTGAFVVIGQRVHHQDLCGHLLDKGGWTHLCLPARYESDHPHLSAHDPRTEDGELLWPDRFPEETLRKLEDDLGTYGSAGQMQQRPAPRSGGMFDRNWWDFVEAAPAGGVVVRGWDLAGTEEAKAKKIGAAWTAGCRMRLVKGEYYIEDMNRFRGSPAQVEKAVKNTAENDGHNVLVDFPQDPGQAGKAQVLYLVKQMAGYNVRYSTESGAKEVRAEALSAQAEAGNVKLVRGPWNKAFIDEAALFPNSDFSGPDRCCESLLPPIDQVSKESFSLSAHRYKLKSNGCTRFILIQIPSKSPGFPDRDSGLRRGHYLRRLRCGV